MTYTIVVCFRCYLIHEPATTPFIHVDARCSYMGVSKNRGTPKWMVKIMENPIEMDDLGENPLFSETSIYIYTYFDNYCSR